MKAGETVNEAPVVTGMAGSRTATALRGAEFFVKDLAAERD
jgi:hypothetical protein